LPGKVILAGTVFKHTPEGWKLTQEGLAMAQRTAGDFKPFGPEVRLEVTGYSSSTGTHAQNLAVSRARAECVAEALHKAGIPNERMTVKGLGPENPIGDNATHEGRMKNQRVEIEFRGP
jgi:outer membrane protein OmpA-like peptidoglycan-associated protein